MCGTRQPMAPKRGYAFETLLVSPPLPYLPCSALCYAALDYPCTPNKMERELGLAVRRVNPRFLWFQCRAYMFVSRIPLLTTQRKNWAYEHETYSRPKVSAEEAQGAVVRQESTGWRIWPPPVLLPMRFHWNAAHLRCG